MKITLFQLCMMFIVSALSLLVVPDFLLFTWQRAGLGILLLVMNTLCSHWFNYFKARNFCMSGILFLLTLAYAHSPALSLLGQAEKISSLPNKITLDLYISEILHFRKILTAWHEQIVEEASRTVAHMQDEASNFPDPADRATQEEEFSLELRNRDRERKLMKKIEYTLKKLDTDDFGYCDSCGEEICIRRLDARPTADLCIDCKTLAEIREKQVAG